jgi:hypothetical protein
VFLILASVDLSPEVAKVSVNLALIREWWAHLSPRIPGGQGAPRALGDLSPTGRLDHEPHLHPEPAEHVDQRLDAEEM